MHDLVNGFLEIRLGERLTDIHALSHEERIRHTAADDQLVDFSDEVHQHGDFTGYFCAANDGRRGRVRFFQCRTKRLDLLHHQRAGVGREQTCDGVRGGVGAVRGREGIVDVDVSQLGQLLRERRIVLLLAFVKAQVLQHGNLTRLEGVDCRPGVRADAIADEHHGLADEARQSRSDRLQGEFRIRTAFRPAEVGNQDHMRAALGEIADA